MGDASVVPELRCFLDSGGTSLDSHGRGRCRWLSSEPSELVEKPTRSVQEVTSDPDGDLFSYVLLQDAASTAYQALSGYCLTLHYPSPAKMR